MTGANQLHPIVQHMRLITGLLLIITFARICGSSYPLPATSAQSDQRRSRETQAEIAHWAAKIKSSDQEERREAAVRLSHIEGAAAVSALVSALTDSSPGVRALVLGGLAERSDTSVVPFLVARLTSDKDAFVRKTAAYALGSYSGAERTAALVAALKAKDLELRGAAAVSLGDHADAAAVAPLAIALSDKNAFVRARAAQALGVNRSAAMQAVPALTKLLASDEDVEVKRQVAAALGSIGDRSALPALERASRDGDAYLAEAALNSIRTINGTR